MHDRQDLYALRPDAVYDTVGKTENPATPDVVFESRKQQWEPLNPTNRITHG
jgi:hypothetical protein